VLLWANDIVLAIAKALANPIIVFIFIVRSSWVLPPWEDNWANALSFRAYGLQKVAQRLALLVWHVMAATRPHLSGCTVRRYDAEFARMPRPEKISVSPLYGWRFFRSSATSAPRFPRGCGTMWWASSGCELATADN
jgi:hypothetical protein